VWRAHQGDYVSYAKGNNAQAFECRMTGAQMADKLDASIDSEPLRAMLTDDSQVSILVDSFVLAVFFLCMYTFHFQVDCALWRCVGFSHSHERTSL